MLGLLADRLVVAESNNESRDAAAAAAAVAAAAAAAGRVNDVIECFLPTLFNEGWKIGEAGLRRYRRTEG
jgi:hypothetical protein